MQKHLIFIIDKTITSLSKMSDKKTEPYRR